MGGTMYLECVCQKQTNNKHESQSRQSDLEACIMNCQSDDEQNEYKFKIQGVKHKEQTAGSMSIHRRTFNQLQHFKYYNTLGRSIGKTRVPIGPPIYYMAANKPPRDSNCMALSFRVYC